MTNIWTRLMRSWEVTSGPPGPHWSGERERERACPAVSELPGRWEEPGLVSMEDMNCYIWYLWELDTDILFTLPHSTWSGTLEEIWTLLWQGNIATFWWSVACGWWCDFLMLNLYKQSHTTHVIHKYVIIVSYLTLDLELMFFLLKSTESNINICYH